MPQTIDIFEDCWVAERPDLDPEAVSTDLRLQLAALRFSQNSTAALTEFDLEWWEYDVLSALRRQGQPYECAVNEISDILPLSSGALTNRLDRLVKRQLVSRKNDTEDRRRVLVRLTSKGFALADQAATKRFAAAAKSLDRLTESEWNTLDTLLDKLIQS